MIDLAAAGTPTGPIALAYEATVQMYSGFPLSSSCAGASESVLHALVLHQAAVLTVSASALDGPAPVLQLRGSCDDGRSELACTADFAVRPLRRTLAPGVYFLGVAKRQSYLAGGYRLEVSWEPPPVDGDPCNVTPGSGVECAPGLACGVRAGSAGTGVCRPAVGAGEACDPAVMTNACISGFTCDPATATCRTTCGDGLVQGLEECDPPNATCSAECRELGHTCHEPVELVWEPSWSSATLAGSTRGWSEGSITCALGSTDAPEFFARFTAPETGGYAFRAIGFDLGVELRDAATAGRSSTAARGNTRGRRKWPAPSSRPERRSTSRSTARFRSWRTADRSYSR